MFSSKFRSIFLLAVLLLAVVFTMTACGGGAKSNVLTVGVDDTYPPMEFKNEKNETVGFDVEMAKEIAKKLGKEAKFVSNDWAGIFQALQADKFDCIISSVSITEERLQSYTFTKPYIANAQVIVVAPGNDSIKEPKDLAGKKVGVQIETTADESCQSYKKDMGIDFELKQYDQVIQPFQELKTGRIDAIVVDEVVARYYVTTDSKSYKVTGARLTNEPIGVCIKKENTKLRDDIQKAIDELKADGTLKKISEKWFGEDLVSNVEENAK